MVRRFVNRDLVDPGLQAAFALELIDFPEDFNENILKYVRRVGRVLEDVQDEIENGMLINSQKVAKGLLGTRLQFRHEHGFISGDPCRAPKSGFSGRD